jgi:small subunit ribosomal protein S20
MAKRHTSAMKRMRQDQKRRLRNTSIKAALRTYTKRVETLVAQNDVTNAAAMLRKATSVLDKAASKHVIHANRAARKKAALSRKVHLLQAGR